MLVWLAQKLCKHESTRWYPTYLYDRIGTAPFGYEVNVCRSCGRLKHGWRPVSDTEFQLAYANGQFLDR